MRKNIKFEDALQNLEGIVKLLEEGTLSLDESMSKYEEAMKLAKTCNELLESAEQKVKILIKSEDGSVSDLPFDQDEN